MTIELAGEISNSGAQGATSDGLVYREDTARVEVHRATASEDFYESL
jgi:hypothetical protein